LRQQGITPVAEIALADHQVYQAAVIEKLVAAAGRADFFLTTEKDAVKLDQAQLPLPCYQVPLHIAIEPFAPLAEKLRELLAKESTS